MRSLILVLALGTMTLAQDGTAPPRTVKADQDFATQYNELMALQVTIDQLEKQAGIPKLRDMSQQKVAALRAWITAHHVEGWKYDEKTQTFTEVKIQPPAPAQEKKDKP